MKILVCDDIQTRAMETRERIEAVNTDYQADVLAGEDLTTQIDHLFGRARSMLTRNSAVAPTPSRFEGEDYDIAILDNNLSELTISGALHTAESIAGYVRAFGTIPYIVSLNKNPHVDFDLRYLVGDYQTLADIAVNDSHLSNPGLWTGNPQDATDGFLPWYWPALNEAPHRRRCQISFVKNRLKDPILPSLDFPDSARDHLSRHARGALSPGTEAVQSVTFLEFFKTACRSLPNLAHREELAGVAAESERAGDVVARVAAGEMDRWIRRELLGPQDVLVDVPHLLMRMPFLLGSHGDDLKHWNRTLIGKEPPYGLSTEIYETHLQAVGFVHDAWSERPCFWWRDLKMNAELNRMFYDGEAGWVDAVFCEDSSRFVRASDDGDSTTEFAAEFGGYWNRRHVEYLPPKQYAPRSRFAK